MVIFAPQNLIMDPPFTKLDLLTCRNLLIYLEADLQKKLLPLFHYSLNPGGILLLGNSETIGQATDLFAPLSDKMRLYRRRDVALRADMVEFPSAFTRPRGYAAAVPAPPTPELPSALNLKTLTDSLLLQRYSPAAVMTTERGDIVYISGKTGKYLEPAAGKANLNIFAMSREGLSSVLNQAFSKAVRQKAVVRLKAVPVGTNGGTQVVDIIVHPLTEPAALQGMVLIVFTDVAAPTVAKEPGKIERGVANSARLAALNEELQQAREGLQITREEMQTSQEELQSTNEELQSTNEELTTSKEEMQSMNEELQTVNHELQAKVDELSLASDDMKNLLNSTDIATLFLDDDLKVQRFTTQTAAIFKLIPGDAGRPITDLVSELDYPRLADDAREVLRSLVFRQQQISARDGRWFTVRIMPYRTQDNRINGVVITFVDISVSKAMEGSLREALSLLQSRFTEQSTELDTARALEGLLQKTQSILEQRLADQTVELQQTQSNMLQEKGRKA